MEYDAAVVGGGVMGYSTALELARHGARTVLLEQFPSPHTRGSSTGQSRITRIANCGAQEMNAIMAAALQAWRNIEKEINKELLIPAPLLCVGTARYMANMRRSIVEAGGQPLPTTVQELRQQFGYNFPADLETFFDTKAAVMLADQCILALKELFIRYGGTVRDRWPVSTVTPLVDNKVKISGPNDGHIIASKVAICAGPWTGPLMKSLGIDLPLTSVRTSVWYWKPKQDDFKGHSFMYMDSDVPTHDFYYGLRSVEYPGLIKLCVHAGVPCDPDHRDIVATNDLLVRGQQFVAEVFPCLHPQPVIKEACMYTLTPDQEMILDVVPDHPNIAFACGFSGAGFKIGPTVGRLLRQLLHGEELDHDISRFRAARFTRPQAKY